MNYEQFKSELCSIDFSKECFSFLAERIGDDGYRGIQCSQHNRYDMDFVYAILDELYRIAGSEKLIIRTTDLQKRPNNLPEEATYAIYVDRLSRRLGRCTQDSVRKNFFVDLHRMGLIERFNSKGKPLGAYERGQIKYVRISALGIDFINSEHTLLERKLRYTRAIDTLTRGLADKMLIIGELDASVSETEFQFFLSFTGEMLNRHRYGMSELVEYVKEFRRLSRYQRERAVELVKEYCNPNNFDGDKTDKRDFHNWLNETQQIFMLLGQTAYYEHFDNCLNIRVGRDSVYESKEKFIRSNAEKSKYFNEHSVKKELGFELHHIVPLCWAKDALEFSTLDVWKNMIYIDGYKHSIITQCNNRHVILDFDGDDMVLSDFNNDKIYFEHKVNVIYNPKHQNTMLEYNTDLISSCGAS